MSDDETKKDDEPIGEFDNTNGLAGNLEGDDGGAENPEGEHPGVLPNLVADPYDEFDRDEVDRGYSEEGHE